MRCGSILGSRTIRGGQYSPDLFGNLRQRVLLQVTSIAVEFSDAFGELLRRHRISVVHPAKGLFIEQQPLLFVRQCLRRIELTLKGSFRLLQLLEQIWTDREQVASSQPHDLIHVAEACAHHLGLVAKLLVVVVNACDGGYARILVGWDLCTTLLVVPVVNSADERRNQSYASLRARDGLRKA